MSRTISTRGFDSAGTEVGQSVRLQLPDGQVIDGVVIRADARTLRLRPAGRGGLMVVHRGAATVLSATTERLAA